MRLLHFHANNYTARHTTCTGAGLSPGCCSLPGYYSCYVPEGNCYCDNICHIFNDCCHDVLYDTQCSAPGRGKTIMLLNKLRADWPVWKLHVNAWKACSLLMMICCDACMRIINTKVYHMYIYNTKYLIARNFGGELNLVFWWFVFTTKSSQNLLLRDSPTTKSNLRA